MRAVVYAGPNAVRVEDVPAPRIQLPGDALVRIERSAVCGTDLHAISGHFPGLAPGMVLGHEFVGTVVEVGPGVQAIKAGDRVMASDFTACGRCRWCARGDHWECGERAFFGTGSAFGPPLAGAQAEQVRVPFADVTLATIPAGCSDEAALLVGDNLATGWVAIERGGVTPGEVVAVLGGGAVGQLTSLCAQAVGAAAVVVVEPNAQRRAFAERHGALGTPPDQAAALLRDITAGDGADVVIEAVGHGAALADALKLVRRRGRVVSVGAHAAPGWELPLARSFADELTLAFAVGDSIRVRRRLLSLVCSGVLDPCVVIGARVGLADVPRAYRELAAQQVLKAVIDVAR